MELLLSIYVSTLHSSFTPFVNPFCLSIANGDIDWLLDGCWVGTLRFSLDLQFSRHLSSRRIYILHGGVKEPYLKPAGLVSLVISLVPGLLSLERNPSLNLLSYLVIPE